MRPNYKNPADVVGVVEFGEEVDYGEFENNRDVRGWDAFFFRNGNGHEFPVKWNHCSKSMFRRQVALLNGSDDDQKECVICYEEINPLGALRCPQCSARVCFLCEMKMALSEENIMHIRIRPNCFGIGEMNACQPCLRCPNCRCGWDGYIENYYVRVMHQLDEFTENQQKVLLYMKANDPKFDVRLA